MKTTLPALNLVAPIYAPGNIAFPDSGTSYREYLANYGLMGRGFSYSELVKPRHRDWRGKFRPPERELIANGNQTGGWHRMVSTLWLAMELRRRMMTRHGAAGLRVAAAYRPNGGSRRSQHKVNSALDLDLLKQDRDITNQYYAEAVRLWSDFGHLFQMGLGLYCGPNGRGGIRVHLDTGYRCRTWQYSGSRSIRPPLALRLVDELDLRDPRRGE